MIVKTLFTVALFVLIASMGLTIYLDGKFEE